MEWKDIANEVADAAPAIGRVLVGPAGGAAGTVLSSVFGSKNTPNAVAEAIQADPEATAKIKRAEMDNATEMRRLTLESETSRLVEINKTMRAEMKSDNLFKSGWRPAIGWVAAMVFGGIGFGLVYAIYEAPADTPDIIGSATVILSLMLGVLGVNIDRRSKDKQVQAGQTPKGIIQALVEKNGQK